MTQERPTLSVVVPYYKGAATIREAVESILDQTVPADEIVIVDDGSPDDIEAALGDLRSRVTVVRQRNGGISAAMNAATEAASGEFVVQLDQDDVFAPRRLEAIAAIAAAQPGADVIATGAQIEYGGERVTTIGVQSLTPEQQRLGIIGDCFFLWPAVRRTRLRAIGGYDESFPVMQDWECFIRLVLDGAEVAYTQEPLYHWRLTPGSRSAADGVENAEALIRVMTKTLGHPSLDEHEREAVQRALESHRRRLLLEQAHYAVVSAAPDARRRSRAVAAEAEFRPVTRAKAAVAVVSPTLARWLIARRGDHNPGREALTRRGFQADG